MHGQAQNEVKFAFHVKFDRAVQGRSAPKIIGILTKVFCTYVSNLVILAWTADELSCGQASDWYTHTLTDTQTGAMTIPEGQNWPRVKIEMPDMSFPSASARLQYVFESAKLLNILRPRQTGHHFADDTFKRIFLDENVRVSIRISLKFVLKGPIDNIPALVQIMAWRRSGDKPLSEPMMVNSLTHICVTRPQWLNFIPKFLKDIVKHEEKCSTNFSRCT